ncbi:MAG: MFS transporter [Proteobacteria bacterium]|nr:MFS transporter [Pseudomonadota bacterium]
MTASDFAATAPGRTLRAAPDGLVAAAMLSFLATAGFFYVNIMPAIVSGLVDGLRFGAREAGWVGAANVYGAVAGALLAVFLSPRVPWRRVAVVALCALIGIDLVSITIAHPWPLIVTRFIHGTVGGTLVGTSFAVIARTRVPERTFGMLLIVQYGLGGLALLLLPRLIPVFGSRLLFLVLAAFSVATLTMLPFLAEYPPRPARAAPGEPTQAPARTGVLLVLSLLAVLLFQCGNMAISAYVIELGRASGLGLERISGVLGVAGWLGALGAVLVMVLKLRAGRLRPILAGLLLCIAGTLAFRYSGTAWAYAAANIATAIAWAFGIPYLLGMCASFDRSGRAATLASVFSKLGLASGPLLASAFVREGHWLGLITVASLAIAGSLACALRPAAQIDRIS